MTSNFKVRNAYDPKGRSAIAVTQVDSSIMSNAYPAMLQPLTLPPAIRVTANSKAMDEIKSQNVQKFQATWVDPSSIYKWLGIGFAGFLVLYLIRGRL